MTDPRVTITLGRSGQVVKRPRNSFDVLSSDSGLRSGTGSKRLREDATLRKFRSDSANAERLGRHDLRLKLTRKRMFRRMHHEMKDFKRNDQHKMVSANVQSPGEPQMRFSRHVSSPEQKSELMPVGRFGRSYSRSSPDRLLKASRGMSLTRTEDLRHVTLSRPVGASRTEQVLRSSAFEASRLKEPTLIPKNVLSAGNVTEFSPAGARMLRSSYNGDEPQTVNSLLHSLGLGKYSVQFRAEEVDMAVLKQMGDNDLKEMGIPMGPRKKILLALKTSSNRHPT